jgi:nucleotide-binding universal stress UspA family protein
VIFDRIVCGFDGSPAGCEALRQAVLLRPTDGRLLAVTISETRLAARTGVHAARFAAQLRDEAEETRARAPAEIDGIPFAEARIVAGRPIPSLLAVAGHERATLIAVGTHGGIRAAGILLGSVATAMLHDAPCAVMVTRPPADGRWFPHRIVVGADGSPESLEAAAVATGVAGRFGSESSTLVAQGGSSLDETGLSRLARVEWDRRGPVAALVAASRQADLIVLGARGLDGVGALGSVSERVAHRAHCSVLVVRPLTRFVDAADSEDERDAGRCPADTGRR